MSVFVPMQQLCCEGGLQNLLPFEARVHQACTLCACGALSGQAPGRQGLGPYGQNPDCGATPSMSIPVEVMHQNRINQQRAQL